jgi:putative ABC transport system substrate-binding protein
MKRRGVTALLVAAPAILAASARAQSMPVIGFLHAGSAAQNTRRVEAFRKGLASAGLVEGRNVAIEFRWADGKLEQLAPFTNELIARNVGVIATLSSTTAAVAARGVTKTVPIYFLIADPPVDLGLVESLGRPGGNATGIVTLAVELVPKRLDLMRQVAPKATRLALLVNPTHPSAKAVAEAHVKTALSFGLDTQVLEAVSDAEIEAAYGAIKPATALLVGTDPSFFARRAKLVALSAKHAVPTMFDSIETAKAGGLMSYGADIERLWERAGVNIARILKGEKPANLPVEQASRFQFAINLKTAKALDLEVGPKLQAVADELID